jgi:hypothetical protein
MVETQLGAYNLECQKDLVLMGTAPHLQSMGRKMTKQERRQMHNSEPTPNTLHGHNETFGKFSRGLPESLKRTQAYPLAFGAANAIAFHEAQTVDLSKPMVPGNTLDFDDDLDVPGLVDSDDDPFLEDLKSSDPTYWKPAFHKDARISLPWTYSWNSSSSSV